MATKIDLASKLRHAMEEAGHKPSQVAEACGIRTPSVYGWLKHGRIAKKHLGTLAQLYGYPVTWWLDAQDDEAMLTKKEKELVESFRQIGEQDKEQLTRYARLLAGSASPQQAADSTQDE